jgi:hypothetical protein
MAERLSWLSRGGGCRTRRAAHRLQRGTRGSCSFPGARRQPAGPTAAACRPPSPPPPAHQRAG